MKCDRYDAQERWELGHASQGDANDGESLHPGSGVIALQASLAKETRACVARVSGSPWQSRLVQHAAVEICQ